MAKPPLVKLLYHIHLQIFSIPVTAEIDPGEGDDNPSSFWDGKLLRPIVFAPQVDGGAKVGWTDTEGTVHITPLDRQMRRDMKKFIDNKFLTRYTSSSAKPGQEYPDVRGLPWHSPTHLARA